MKKLLAIPAALALFAAAGPANAGPVNPVLEIVFLPIVKLAEAQSFLSPEKDSCWNDGAAEVVGCNLAAQVEARPTTLD